MIYFSLNSASSCFFSLCWLISSFWFYISTLNSYFTKGYKSSLHFLMACEYLWSQFSAALWQCLSGEFFVCFSVSFFLFPFFYVSINLVLIIFNNCSSSSDKVPFGPAIYRRFSWEKPRTVPGQQKIPLVHCEVPSDKGLWVNEFVSSFFFLILLLRYNFHTTKWVLLIITSP